MCTVSMIMDQFIKTPWVQPNPPTWVPVDFVPAWRVDQLEQRVKLLEDMLAAAKKYDEDNGEPNCELESKKETLKELAKQLGVEINFP